MEKHWDGRGHEILDFFGMRMYYQFDPISLGVIMKVPPRRYEVIPTVKLVINKNDPKTCRFYRLYPVEQTCNIVELKDNQIKRLREIFCFGWGWKVTRDLDEITFTRLGRIKIIEVAPQGGAF